MEAAVWTSSGGMVGLGDLAGGGYGSIAYDVSADGSVVVVLASSDSGFEAFRWTQQDGMVKLEPGGLGATAGAASADGSVVVGAIWWRSQPHEIANPSVPRY